MDHPTSSAENEELKRKKKEFNKLIHQAKEKEEAGQFDAALDCYKSALVVMPSHEKLPNKIEKLSKKLEHLKTLTVIDEKWRRDDKNGEVIMDAGTAFQYSMSGSVFDKLFPHQRVGVSWMWSLFKKSSGGILGDDMGLGKTIQVSAFLHGLFHSQLIDTALLIMPLSLMSNWESELAVWCPKKRVRQFHGAAATREKALSEVLSKSGIVLTTYETAQSAFKSLSMSSEDEPLKWDVIILDEGHKIKDPSKKTSKAIATFQARSKFILSGTPILNNLKELWALLNYTCDGQLLGDMKVFRKEFEDPIMRGQTKDATDYEKKKGFAVTNKLRALIEPHFIRRLKSDIMVKPEAAAAADSAKKAENPMEQENALNSTLTTPGKASSLEADLKKSSSGVEEDWAGELSLSLGGLEIRSPSKNVNMSHAPKPAKMGLTVKKNDFVCWIPIEPLQLAIYTQFLISQRDRINEAIATTGQALGAIRVLRQITNHPRLLRQETEADTLAFPGFNFPQLSRAAVVEQSGKVRFLLDLLKRLKKEGHRVLIFSQSVKMLDLIETAVTESQTGWKWLRMDGSINKVAERKALVDEYNTNSGIFLFLMTTQVGGVGITLTSADRVVIFDPAWNTAMDDQAADRVYRIGQKRNVVIYRLISSGTIEEKMYRKQVFKGALSKSLLGKEAAVHNYFTRGELRELFTFDPDDVKEAQTQTLLASMHSHKRDTYPELEAEVDYLKTLPTLVGISDHNLLYTEEATAMSENSESIQAARQAHELLAKTIVPKDVIALEQAENSAKMATRGPKGPITTIYLDGGQTGRPRRDPSQIGTRVGDITLLTVDDQFELGLAQLQVTQARVRKNPFAAKERPRGGNLGGNDRVHALPIVSKKAPSPNSAPVNAPRTQNKPVKFPSPVALPTVKKSGVAGATGSHLHLPAKPKPSAEPVPKQPATVVIKKASSVLPANPVAASTNVRTSEPESVEDEIARLLNEVSIAHDLKREEKLARAACAVAAPAAAPVVSNPPQTPSLGLTSSVVKPHRRRLIEEDDDDPMDECVLPPLVAPVKISASAELKELAVPEAALLESGVKAPVTAATSKSALPVPEVHEEPKAVSEDVKKDVVSLVEQEIEPKVTVKWPKMSRKSIVSFEQRPDENELEVIEIDALLDEEVRISGEKEEEEDEELEEEEEEEEEDDSCSEASESEMTLLAAEKRGNREGPLSKHFLESTGYSTEEEERGAMSLDGDEDDEDESAEETEGDEDDDMGSFLAPEDDEEDDVVEYDEHDEVIKKLLSAKTGREESEDGKEGAAQSVGKSAPHPGPSERGRVTSEPRTSATTPASVAPRAAVASVSSRSKRIIEESDEEASL
jgi:SNF2 family DNA or RNA helicase